MTMAERGTRHVGKGAFVGQGGGRLYAWHPYVLLSKVPPCQGSGSHLLSRGVWTWIQGISGFNGTLRMSEWFCHVSGFS